MKSYMVIYGDEEGTERKFGALEEAAAFCRRLDGKRYELWEQNDEGVSLVDLDGNPKPLKSMFGR